MRKAVITLSALTAVLALAGCGKEEKPAATAMEIKIGHVAPLTGSIAPLALPLSLTLTLCSKLSVVFFSPPGGSG